ncbi:hypothetical protein [Vibrio aestuarianus]|uniref:Uncharacterized protein n=1 Tax=Vibrio aestuarianus TaxID=28171 RepID=A0A9X4IZM8_9VIBR|nr:hypothetical protein [Vibrio aestuarianus]MDE1263448.1 hypothetical protein [Vibrio aestuarianus]MDE1295552.1 hypothetical protein [Vibrio aestuarianus]MDE1346665.1 hypothetical protein [Vibrio aestuarianus]CAH8189324.1 hypothetical protein VAE122_1910001 [Vibrio aestuarianus]
MSSEQFATKVPRIITLSGEEVHEDDAGGFVSWRCTDYVYEGKVLTELGWFNNPDLESIGFILYDGSSIGQTTLYERKGLNHRWDWGSGTDLNYAFIIKPDGTGLYYDFSSVRPGDSTKASSIYKCTQ